MGNEVIQLNIFGDTKPAEIIKENKQAGDEYSVFVEKFKPKKTTDDCYTPPAVYDAILGWVRKNAEIDITGIQVVRPFYPGGNYKTFDYPENCVVIDNPPFSILSAIVRFYVATEIPFFLFGPHLTLISSAGKANVTILPISAHIVYENGAVVNTGFISNLFGSLAVLTSKDLRDTIQAACAVDKPTLPKYEYPAHVFTVSMAAKYLNKGIETRIDRKDVTFISKLDAQKADGKSIFGGGYLLSEKAAAEKAAAEKAVAEKAVAENRYVWELSERERKIINKLG